MASEIRVNKIINRSGLSTVTFTDDGAIVSGIVSATVYTGSGANLTDLPAGNLSGTLPAISATNLTSIPAANLTGTVADARLSTVSSSKLSGALPAIDGASLTGVTAAGLSTTASINTSGIITATNLELAIPTSRRNFFINGDMNVAARGTVTGLNAGGYGGPDHIKLVNNLGTFTVSQGNENDSPRSEGFTNSYKLNCTSASGPSASNYVYLYHVFSGFDLQQLKYGYTNPHPITISFWAKSNKTGNFTVTFRTIAGVDRLISKVLTISDSNWNFYSVTFPGDTSAVNVTTGMAYLLEIWLDGGSNYTGGTVQTSWSARSNADRGAGSTLNIASSTSNYFYYTGLQVELGAVATPFEHQLLQWYEFECYRFFYHPNRGSDLLELHGMGHRIADTMGAVVQAYPWPRQMRVAPTISFDDNAGNSNRFAVNGSNNSTVNNVSLSLQQNDQGIMGAFQYPHGITNISENESFRLWAYNFKADAEF